MRFKLLIWIFVSLVFLYGVNAVGCCGKLTGTGENFYCQAPGSVVGCDMTNPSEYPFSLIAKDCTEIDKCKPVCCVFDDGTCSENVPKLKCTKEKDGIPKNGLCSTHSNECGKGCCKSANYKLTTSGECNDLTLEGAEVNFEPGIDNEEECIESGRNPADLACCVIGEGENLECESMSWRECETAGGSINEGDCSSVLDCEAQCGEIRTDCGEDPDSKNIYEYNDCGLYRLKEDCYIEGKICKKNEITDVAECVDAGCSTTWDNLFNENDGGSRKLGEEWCETLGGPSKYFNTVGSVDFLHSCQFGEEVADRVSDYREKYCLEEEDTFFGEIGSTAEKKDNRYLDCYTCNDDTQYVTTKEKKDCCNRPDIRDCIWVGCVGKDTEKNINKKTGKSTGRCVPNIPPGFKKDTGGEENTDYSSLCSNGNLITETESQSPIGGLWTIEQGYFQCKKNCLIYWGSNYKGGLGLKEYTPQSINEGPVNFLKTTNSLCVLQGDCGNWKNIGGSFTNYGYDRECQKKSFAKYCNFFENYYDTQGLNAEVYAIDQIEADYAEYCQQSDISEYGDFQKEKNFDFTLLNGVGSYVYYMSNFESHWYDDKAERYVKTKCTPWEAPHNGDDCWRCNKGESGCEGDKCGLLPELNGEIIKGYGCYEYACHSLGTTCEIDEFNNCYNGGNDDTTTPKIEPDLLSWAENECVSGSCSLTEKYLGFEANEVIKAHTEVSFKFTTTEPANCRFDSDLSEGLRESTNANEENFEQLSDTDDYSSWSTEEEKNEASFPTDHELIFSGLPSGEHDYYIACKDHNNVYGTIMKLKFTVEEGPDTQVPIIKEYIVNGEEQESPAYVMAGGETFEITLKVSEQDNGDEEVVCRWSKNRENFESMEKENGENEVGCSLEEGYFNCDFSDTKALPLDITKTEEKFYFACKDGQGNFNNDGWPSSGYEIIQTSELVMDLIFVSGETCSLSEEGYICYDGEISLGISLTGGAENGKSICRYEGSKNEQVVFSDEFAEEWENEYTLEHSLLGGDYDYTIICHDKAGNEAKQSVKVSIEEDLTSPQFIKVSGLSGGFRILVSDENLITCKYSNTVKNFNFDSETKLLDINPKENNYYEADCDCGAGIYYVKCKDLYNNKMNPITVYLK